MSSRRDQRCQHLAGPVDSGPVFSYLGKRVTVFGTRWGAQTGYYADVIEEAAALWESLAQNHPFIDGNKRTAFAATYTYLAINGGRLTANAESTYQFIADLYAKGGFTFSALAPWLRQNVRLDRLD